MFGDWDLTMATKNVHTFLLGTFHTWLSHASHIAWKPQSSRTIHFSTLPLFNCTIISEQYSGVNMHSQWLPPFPMEWACIYLPHYYCKEVCDFAGSYIINLYLPLLFWLEPYLVTFKELVGAMQHTLLNSTEKNVYTVNKFIVILKIIMDVNFSLILIFSLNSKQPFLHVRFLLITLPSLFKYLISSASAKQYYSKCQRLWRLRYRFMNMWHSKTAWNGTLYGTHPAIKNFTCLSD